jgi:CBS-domain-containing membrane protein
MRKLIYIIVIGFGSAVHGYGQEIIPFPDLAIQHDSAQETLDDQNYALYTADYQNALTRLDQEIELTRQELERTSNQASSKALEKKKEDLIRKRAALLEEAELVEDLNKFY